MKNKRPNLEVLQIIIGAWNYHMAEANAICAKSDIEYDQELLDLASFVTGKNVSMSDIIQPKSEYANQCIDHYNAFKEISKNIKYTRWKSLRKNPLIKTYGVMFDIYLSNGFNTEFLKRVPFFRMTPRQFAKVFIKIKQSV